MCSDDASGGVRIERPRARDAPERCGPARVSRMTPGTASERDLRTDVVRGVV
jgi:hypothetical protein